MFLLIQPFLPAPSSLTQPKAGSPQIPAVATWLASLPSASPHFCPPPMSKVRQHLLKHSSSSSNVLVQNIQWDNRSEYQAGMALLRWEGGLDTT